MIEVTHVTKRFGALCAVNDVSWALATGQSLALWGGNGAGKTTLIRCVLGMMRCQGTITIGGHNVARQGKKARRLVGYVPQELAFHDDMRLGVAMRFFASLRGVSIHSAHDRLALVELHGQERKRVRDLSGGMKQRLALAIALLGDPPIICMDEPTSNLDAGGRRDVVDMLVQLRTKGKTILFASHRQDEVLALADRMLLIDRGRVQRDTTPREQWPQGARLQTVRLHVSELDRMRAELVLRQAGHVVHNNGHGLCVEIASDTKALPIHALIRSDIEVRDFELIEPHHLEGRTS